MIPAIRIQQAITPPNMAKIELMDYQRILLHSLNQPSQNDIPVVQKPPHGRQINKSGKKIITTRKPRTN